MVGQELYEIASVQQQRGDGPVPVTAFDPAFELLWSGSSGGGIQGALCPGLERYSVWRGHVQPVVGLLSTIHGPLSASADALQLCAHGGLPLMKYREPAADIRCCEWERPAGTRVALGHSSGRLSVLDLSTAQIASQTSCSQGVEVLRGNGRVLACGGNQGEVALYDVRSRRAETTILAHQGAVTALDMKGDLLVSSGMSMRTGVLACDTLVKVFDIRQGARALTHVSFPPGPAMLRFQPKFSSLLMLAANNGAVLLTDVQGGGIGFQSFQVDCEGDALLCCDVSTSGELIAFGDSGGYVHLWASHDDARVNLFSQPLELFDPTPPPPHQPLTELDPPTLAYRPMGTEPPLSALDPNVSFRVGLPPRLVDPSLQEAMSVVDFVGYVANPYWRRGMSYAEALRATASLRNARQKRRTEGGKGSDSGSRLALAAGLRGVHGAFGLPRGYRRVEIKQSQSAKFEEFDFSYYNKTRFAGLENDILNSYINPLLQVLYFIPDLKESVTHHICEREFCLTCELGFVMHMLALAEGATCQPSNLLRALRQIREASALGLVEGPDEWENSKEKSLARRIQNLSRFLLEQLHKEAGGPTAGEGILSGEHSIADQLFGLTVQTRTKCLRTPHEDTMQDRRSFQVDLQYPSSRSLPRPSFAQILQRSLGKQEEMRAWCQACRGYQPVLQTKMVGSLPQVLIINCCVKSSDAELFFWRTEQAKDESSRPVLTRSYSGMGASEQWLPFHIDIVLRSSGVEVTEDMTITGARLPDSPPEEEPGILARATYDLTAMIAHVYGDTDDVSGEESSESEYEGHLVAHIKLSAQHAELLGAGGGLCSPSAAGGTASLGMPSHLMARRRSTSPSAATMQAALGQAVPFVPAGSIISGSPTRGVAALPVGSPGAQASPKPSLLSQASGSVSFSSAEWNADGRLDRSGSGHGESRGEGGLYRGEVDLGEAGGQAGLGGGLGVMGGVGQMVGSPGGSSMLTRSDSRGTVNPGDWVLFNDFCITPTSPQEVVSFYGKLKVPCLLYYTCVRSSSSSSSSASSSTTRFPASVPPDRTSQKPQLHISPPGRPLGVRRSPIGDDLFRKLIMDSNRPPPRGARGEEAVRSFWPLELPREQPRPGMLFGIDAEFVALSAAEMASREDGSEYVKRPARLGLARVSVVRGEGPNSSICCIDDYIRTVEPVYDYLTRYSGLVHGDLDPAVSKHYLTSIKKAYLKLRYMVDMGCRFVGHGLKKDFRMINIVVPPEQVVDTVDLFHLKRQRKLSLRFLASYLLKIDIQKDTHDSIEDARTALRLYDKYRQLVASGEFQKTLLEIYHHGRRTGWDLGNASSKDLDHSKALGVAGKQSLRR